MKPGDTPHITHKRNKQLPHQLTNRESAECEEVNASAESKLSPAGRPSTRETDEDIKDLLLSGVAEDEWDKVTQGVALAIELHRGPVYYKVHKAFPGLDEHVLADVCQNAFKELVELVQQGRFHRKGGLRALLNTIAWRRARDYVRGLSNSHVEYRPDVGSDQPDVPGSLDNFLDLVDTIDGFLGEAVSLSKDEWHVLRACMRLYFDDALATSDETWYDAVTREVNRAIDEENKSLAVQSRTQGGPCRAMQHLTVNEVEQSLESGLAELRNHLKIKGYL